MKRKLFLILSVLFLFALLVGCGKKNELKKESAKANSKTQTSAATVKGSKEIKLTEVTEKDFEKTLSKEDKTAWKETSSEDKELILAIASFEKTVEVYITDINREYADKDGYVKPEDKSEYLDKLYNQLYKLKEAGIAKKVTKNVNNVSVISTEDILYFYGPELEGVATGSGMRKLTSFDAWGWADQWLEKYVYLEEAVDVLRFTQNEIIPAAKGRDTIEAIKNINTNGLLLWLSHGAYDAEAGSCLMTGVETSWYLDIVLRDDLATRRIGKVMAGDIYGYILSPSFFENYLADGCLADAVVYLGACESGMSNRLANVLISKGAATVLGYTAETYIGYIVKMAEAIFSDSSIVKANGDYRWPQIGEAVYHAKEQYGEYENLDFVPELAARATDRDSRITIFGDSNKSLIGTRKLEITVRNIGGDPVEGLCRFNDAKTGEHLFDIYSTKEKTGNLTVTVPDIDLYISVDADTYKVKNVPPMGVNTFDIVMERDMDKCFAGGKGTEADPYQIETIDQFKALRDIANEGWNLSDKYFVLTQNIGAKGEEIVIDTFKGHFDGNGHSIASVVQSRSIFNSLEGGEIKNLEISAELTLPTGDLGCNLGGIVGRARNSTIENCIFSEISVLATSGGKYVGGICGHAENSSIINCQNKGIIKSLPSEENDYYKDLSNGFHVEPMTCAGIVGCAEGCTITGCVNTPEKVGVSICFLARDTVFTGCVNEANSCFPLLRSRINGVICHEASECRFVRCVNNGNVYVESHIPYSEYEKLDECGVGVIVGSYYDCEIEGCVNNGSCCYTYLHIGENKNKIASFTDLTFVMKGYDSITENRESQSDNKKDQSNEDISVSIGLPDRFDGNMSNPKVAFVATIQLEAESLSQQVFKEICDGVSVEGNGGLTVSYEAEWFGDATIMVYINVSWDKPGTYTIDLEAGGEKATCNISVTE